jgi:hypothetical protein
MTFTLDDVVPWGRSFGEYLRMFALKESDLGKRILGCADGPASFNAVASRHGCRVVSVDPIYRFSAPEIGEKIEETAPVIAAEMRANASAFVWTHFDSLDEMLEARLEAMDQFLADFPAGKSSRRYVDGQLPDLPFPDDSLDIALCSHFLFLYSEQHDADFHVRSILELLRLAPDIRIFPVLELAAVRSRHLDGVTAQLTERGHGVELVTVDYELQRSGNQMLRVTRGGLLPSQDGGRRGTGSARLLR